MGVGPSRSRVLINSIQNDRKETPKTSIGLRGHHKEERVTCTKVKPESYYRLTVVFFDRFSRTRERGLWFFSESTDKPQKPKNKIQSFVQKKTQIRSHPTQTNTYPVVIIAFSLHTIKTLLPIFCFCCILCSFLFVFFDRPRSLFHQKLCFGLISYPSGHDSD